MQLSQYPVQGPAIRQYCPPVHTPSPGYMHICPNLLGTTRPGSSGPVHEPLELLELLAPLELELLVDVCPLELELELLDMLPLLLVDELLVVPLAPPASDRSHRRCKDTRYCQLLRC